MSRILHIAGARPNFMKCAPIIEAIKRYNQRNVSRSFEQWLVHTGQHYDSAMSELFFQDLKLPAPDVDLGVGSLSNARQTAEVMMRLEPVIEEKNPDLILVVGDVNSTVAASLTGVKMGIPVAHVEAGLRSGDRDMPEEINRIVTDAVSDFLFTTSRIADVNLQREGVPESKIHFVGNTMIDSLLKHRESARCPASLRGAGISRFSVITLHRPSNVDNAKVFTELVGALEAVQKLIHVVFPV